jgi:hypothetical protein
MKQMTRDVVFKVQPRLHDLQTLLGTRGGTPHLELSGDRLGGCLLVPDLEELIAHGRPVPFPAILRRGKPNECHGNCIALFDQDQTLVLMSGFGLADDNKWYHHSWCVQHTNGEKRIIETVGANDHSDRVRDWKFIQYFGIEYRGSEGVQRFRDWLDGCMPAAPAPTPGGLTETIAGILESDPEKLKQDHLQRNPADPTGR